MRQQHLNNLIRDRVGGVQGCQRILHRHGDFFSTKATVFPALQPDKFAAVKADRAFGDKARLFDQTHHAAKGYRLARAGLAHNPQTLAFVNFQADTVDRCDHTVTGIKAGFQVFDFKDWIAHIMHLNHGISDRRHRANLG